MRKKTIVSLLVCTFIAGLFKCLVLEKPKRRSKGRSKEIEALYCLICMESRPMKDIFQHKKATKKCSHPICIECISKYIEAKVEENITTIKCPNIDCKKYIDFDSCINVIPKAVLDRWEDALSKSMISSSTSLYCPFKKCSIMSLYSADVQMIMANCPHCNNKLCTTCKVEWHVGMKCKEFQKLRADERSNEDILLRNLAKDQHWVRCPKCKFYVDKIKGCRHMLCRCGCEFCYDCGLEYKKCRSQICKLIRIQH